MTVQSQDFEMYQGDTKQITISVTDEDDAVLNLAGYDIIWSWYRSTNKEEVLRFTVGDGISVPTPSNGEIIIDLLPEDTEDIVPNTYIHECEISTSPTDISTVTVGTVKILYSKIKH